MRSRPRCLRLCLTGLAVLVAGAAAVLPGAAAGNATVVQARVGVYCPFSATELSTIVGRKLQRVALGGGRAAGQCAFSAVEAGKAVAPQIFLTLGPGNTADLRDNYRYYLGARAQLATRPIVKSRPDLGPAAFTLSVPDASITNAFFVSGESIASLSLDLSDATRPEKQAVTQILALAAKRSS